MNAPQENSPQEHAPARRGFGATLTGITLAALVLVLWRLGDKPFWVDEVQTLYMGTSWASLRDRVVNHESNMWSFYFLLAAWRALAPPTEFALRLLPALLGVAAVPMMAAWGRRIAGERAGLLAAALMAVHGTWLQHGQTLRGYSLLLLLTPAVSWQFMRVVESPRASRVVALALLAALGIYTHLYFVLALGALAATLLFHSPARVPWRVLFAAGALTLVLLVPMALWQPFGKQLDWVLPLSLRDAARLLLYLSGYSGPLLPLYGAGCAVAAVAAGRTLRALGRCDTTWRAVLPLLACMLPTFVLVAVSLAVKPILVPRYLAIALPAVLLAVAVAVDRIPGAKRRRLAVAALLLASMPGLLQWYHRPPVEDWRALCAWLADEGGSADAVVFHPYPHIDSYRYHAGRRDSGEHLPRAVEVASGPYEGGGWGDVPGVRADLQTDLLPCPRVWVVTTGHAEPRRAASPHAAQLRAVVAEAFEPVAARDFGRLRAQLWTRRGDGASGGGALDGQRDAEARAAER